MNDMANYVAASDTMEAFVNAVKVRMQQLGLTQVELAKRLGITQASLSERLGAKRGNCSFAKADEIADALGTTTIELLKSNGSPSRN